MSPANNPPTQILRTLLVLLLIFCLILVRRFEDSLFYDPFLAYFKGDMEAHLFPEYSLSKVSFGIFFRYLLNSLISLGIIGLWFWSWKKMQFTALVLLVFFVLLLPLYLYMIETRFTVGQNIGFYIRRFLIQPVWVLILIPAFYYQEYSGKGN